MTQASTAAPAVPRGTLSWSIHPAARRAVLNVLGVVAFVGVLQAASMWGPQAWRIPTAVEFVDQVVRLVSAPAFLQALADTISSVLIAVCIAIVLAVVIGVGFGSSRALAVAFGLPFEIIRPIPAIALIPLAILAFGQGQSMEIFVAVLACWWSLLFNTIYGVRQVDPVAIDAARSMGCSRFQVAYRIVVPSLLPFVVAGLRTAMPIALVVVVGAQYISTAQRGLGGVLIIAVSGGDLSVLWATAAIAGVLGIFLGGLVELTGRVLCPWAEERSR